MPKYEVELDEARATPEQKVKYPKGGSMLKIAVYSGLQDLGYNTENTLLGEPLETRTPISMDHRKTLETKVGAPLVISEVSPRPWLR